MRVDEKRRAFIKGVNRRCGIFPGIILVFLMAGCATGPDPIIVYEDSKYSVWPTHDPKSGTGHSHPSRLTTEQISTILQGVRIKDRDTLMGFGMLAHKEFTPAFTGPEIKVLAPSLAKALHKASDRDMVTFYIAAPDVKYGKVVTSGGLLVRDQRLYFMLANAYSYPSGGQDYTGAVEFNSRESPLLPITPYRFTVGFRPEDAVIPFKEAREKDSYRPYMDASKMVVVDLERLLTDLAPSSARSLPAQP
jgi:hypothetical protein